MMDPGTGVDASASLHAEISARQGFCAEDVRGPALMTRCAGIFITSILLYMHAKLAWLLLYITLPPNAKKKKDPKG